MNIKEAIKILDIMGKHLVNEIPESEIAIRKYNALDMAIEALKKQAELEVKIIMLEKSADMYDKASDKEPDYGNMKYVHGVSDGIAEAIAVLRGEKV